jgi:hypothetical protein
MFRMRLPGTGLRSLIENRRRVAVRACLAALRAWVHNDHLSGDWPRANAPWRVAFRYCPGFAPPLTPLFLVVLMNLQPFTPPDTLDPPVVDALTCVVQQAGYHPVAAAPVFVGQFDDVFCQTPFICTALRNLVLRASMLTDRAAGTAL